MTPTKPGSTKPGSTLPAGIRLVTALLAAGVLAAGLAACSTGAPTEPASSSAADAVTVTETASPTPPAEEAISVLYSLSADAGTLTPVAGSTTEFALVLATADRHTVWFSDRPARLSGTLTTADLVRDWAGFGFVADPPTVAIVLHDAGDEADTLIAELSAPAYDAATDGFTATVRVLDEQAQRGVGGFEHFAGAADAALPTSFTGVSIFINDESGVVVDGCLVAPYPTC